MNYTQMYYPGKLIDVMFVPQIGDPKPKPIIPAYEGEYEFQVFELIVFATENGMFSNTLQY